MFAQGEETGAKLLQRRIAGDASTGVLASMAGMSLTRIRRATVASLRRARSDFNRRSLGYYAGALCVLLCVLVLIMPSPYVVETPGPTRNVLGTSDGKQIIAISGVATHKQSGQLLMVTVNAAGVPGYAMPNIETLAMYMRSDTTVLPSEAVFPPGQSSEDYDKESHHEMSGSQKSATKQALAYAKRLGVDTSGVRVRMHIDDIGGPSAGMMYTLGTISKLTARDETGGKIIAGTGTMENGGKVGAIGGIRLKMLGAKRDGAAWFLAPASNCDEVVGHVPSGLRDVKVSTLDEAYQALVAIGQGKGEKLPHCTV